MWYYKLLTFTYALLGLWVYGFGFLLDSSEHHIYISPSGSDNNNGLSVAHPFKTVNKAVSYVASLPHSNQDVFVELLSGYHEVYSSLTVHHQVKSLTFKAYDERPVHVIGGKRISSDRFSPVTDQSILHRLPSNARSKVKVIHLPAVGVTNYGHMSEYGYYKERHAPLEIFLNSKPLRLARWPNKGFVNIVATPDGQNGKRFRYAESEPSKWTHESDMWAHGFWYWSWSDRAVSIAKLNTAAKEITLKVAPPFGLRNGHWNNDPVKNRAVGWAQQGGYFRVINVLAELDEPGEYYLDRTTGNLYVWFPTHNGQVKSSDVIYVSLADQCFKLTSGQRDVTFQDFTVEGCRVNAIVGSNLKNITIQNMELSNTGGYNVKTVGDSRDVTIKQNYLHDGDGGISIVGGDRPSLTSSRNLISDNEISWFNREGFVGINGINFGGVGVINRYNHIYGGAYNNLRYWGNDHIIEYNHIHHACLNSSDCGAIMVDKDWTALGVQIRYNYIHDTLKLVPGNPCRAVMLDDQASGAFIENNVFYHNQDHVNIGGGRNNLVINNIFYNGTSTSMTVDGRGLTNKFTAELEKRLHEVPYKSHLWTTRYPQLVGFDSQNKSLPQGNIIKRNVFFNLGTSEGIGGLFGYNGLLDQPFLFNITDNVWAASKHDFNSPDHQDFQLRCYIKDWADSLGIKEPVPFNKVGPRYPVGPISNRRAPQRVTSVGSLRPCTTHAPAAHAPVGAYLPDGSAPNTQYKVGKQGCWLETHGCTNHHELDTGLSRDTYGENTKNAGNNEAACLHRAVERWNYCGQHESDRIVAIYAPTGAVSISSVGCYMATYSCPAHSTDHADGSVAPGRIYRDTYSEEHFNAGHNQEACLRRAVVAWNYCGSSPNHPVTAIYMPTGAIRTAGAGCWIHVLKCAQDPKPHSMFYDAWGATNLNTDQNEEDCLHRAEYFWYRCGSDPQYPVTAYYRPKATSRTVPTH